MPRSAAKSKSKSRPSQSNDVHLEEIRAESPPHGLYERHQPEPNHQDRNHAPQHRRIQRQHTDPTGSIGSDLDGHPRGSHGIHRHSSAPDEGWERALAGHFPSRAIAAGLATIRINRKHTRAGVQTLRLKHGIDQLDTDEIVDNLLNNPDFVDGPDTRQTEDIKGLHTNLARKKSIHARVKESAQKKQRRIGWFTQARYSVSIAWKHFQDNLAEVAYSTDLWRGHLKKVEGKFGSDVASYFRFLKWLFLLNIPVFIVLFAFITVPQLLHRTTLSPAYNHSESFKGIEILTGEGWFKDSELYYGTHLNGLIERVPGTFYNMPLAYLLAVAVYYIITLIALLYRSYKKNFIEASSIVKLQYVTKVICGWDYAITGVDAAKLKKQSLTKELQELMSIFRKSDVNRTDCQKFVLILLRIFINLVILGLIAGAAYLIRYVSESLQVESKFHGLEQLALPVVISAVIYILPFAFSILCGFEKFENPGTTLYLTMARIMLLFIAVLGVLVQFWFQNANCANQDAGSLDSDQACSPCWENFLGYNMYRLVLVDFLVTLLITFFAEFVRRLIAQYCIKALGYPEFNIARNTLYLIYSQALIWLAIFYSPLLPFVVILKVLIIFYVKRYSVMNNCVPSPKSWRGGRTHTVIMFCLGLALLLCFIAVGYSVVRLTPSKVCGPYINRPTAYAVISEFFNAWAKNEPFFSSLLEFVTSAGFLAGVILGLLIAAYYSRIRAKGLDETVESLKEQISMEGKDKKFLIKLLRAAGSRTNQRQRGPKTRDPGNYDDTYLPTAPGGKRFAKAAMASQPSGEDIRYSNDPPGAPSTNPKKKKPANGRSSGASQSPPGGPPTNTDSPGLRRRPNYNSSDSLTPGQAHYSYNEGFIDRSWEPEDTAISSNPAGMNPAYEEGSSPSRPSLPYPGRHYDIYRGSQQ